jgi:hypothetical protein
MSEVYYPKINEHNAYYFKSQFHTPLMGSKNFVTFMPLNIFKTNLSQNLGVLYSQSEPILCLILLIH